MGRWRLSTGRFVWHETLLPSRPDGLARKNCSKIPAAGPLRHSGQAQISPQQWRRQVITCTETQLSSDATERADGPVGDDELPRAAPLPRPCRLESTKNVPAHNRAEGRRVGTVAADGKACVAHVVLDVFEEGPDPFPLAPGAVDMARVVRRERRRRKRGAC